LTSPVEDEEKKPANLIRLEYRYTKKRFMIFRWLDLKSLPVFHLRYLFSSTFKKSGPDMHCCFSPPDE
jgi:hypothetical protein